MNEPLFSTTIISPTFLAAANFIILGALIRILGQEYSRLPASYCTSSTISHSSIVQLKAFLAYRYRLLFELFNLLA